MAHTYWRLRGFKADLLILNQQAGGYIQTLTDQLSNLILSQAHHVGMNQPGGVFLRATDTLPEEDLDLLFAVARVVLVAARGNLMQQMANAASPPAPPPRLALSQRPAEEPSAPLPFLELPYFNGLGGFTTDGREYAIFLGKNETPHGTELSNTPAPWSNVFANPEFGAMLTEAGQGYSWGGNSQSNRLTPWSNDPVSDPSGEAIYIRDEETGVFWTPTAGPIRENDPYRTRHGQGYSIFEHNSHAIEQELTVFVPLDDAAIGTRSGESTSDAKEPSPPGMPPHQQTASAPIKIQRLRLRNQSSRRRRLTVTAYSELILGTTREETQPHIVTAWDTATETLLARNAYHPDFGSLCAFASSSPPPRSHSGDRTLFLGRNGSPSSPGCHAPSRAGRLRWCRL
jgi:cellobiose phosphorylase